MIQYESVSKIYRRGDVEIIHEVDWKINEGEFVILVGVSGAGKTTLLKLLTREETPSSGNIWFKEENIVKLAGWKIPYLRRKIGVVFQDFKLLEQKTVFENIAFVLEVTGKGNAEIQRIVRHLLERINLTERMHAFPKQLSSGEQQRVAIARALAHEPEVLLADEPTGNLDPHNTAQILKLLRQINDSGTTVIVATHDESLIQKHAGTVVELKHGKIAPLKKNILYHKGMND